RCNTSALADIADSQSHEIARPELAVGREIEEYELAGILLQLKPDSDRPDLALLERCLLAHKFALVPRDLAHRSLVRRFHTCLLWSSERGKRVKPAKGRSSTLSGPRAVPIAVIVACRRASRR